MRSALRTLAVALVAVVGSVSATLTLAENGAEEISEHLSLPVTSQVLEDVVRTRADVKKEGSVPLTLVDRIVTDVRVAPGDSVASGQVLAVLEGRPVIAIEGRIPGYRDLGYGAFGPDVEQLETALDQLGLLDRPPGDAYDADTADAVSSLFERVGFAPAMEADLETRRQLKQAVDAAERNLELLRLPDSVRPTLEANLARARAEVEAVEAEAEQLLGSLDQQIASALQAVEDARKENEAESSDESRARVAAAEAEHGRLESEWRATRARLGAEVAAAHLMVDSAEASIAEHDGQLSSQRAAAMAEHEAAVQALIDYDQGAGATLRAAEWVAVPSDSLTVVSMTLSVGTPASVGELVVSSGAVTATAVWPANSPLPQPGDEAHLEFEGERFPSVIDRTESSDDGDYVVTLRAASATSLVGKNVLMVHVAATTLDEVLAVPAAAITRRPGGVTAVLIEDEPEDREVIVEVGQHGQDGLVEVTPVDGRLSVGDAVVLAPET